MAWLDFFVCFFFGMFGVHRFREKKVATGILYLFTAGLFGIGWMVDVIRYLIAACKGQRIIYKNIKFDKNTRCVQCGNELTSEGRYCPRCGADRLNEKPVTSSIWFWLVIIMAALTVVIGGIGSIMEDKKDPDVHDDAPVLNEENDPIQEEAVETETPIVEVQWKQTVDKGLAYDIEYAFAEIGENPGSIESVEFVDETETDLFVLKDYKVSFINAKFKHHRWYRITTKEWDSGEPEYALYPREYLSTIKQWSTDDVAIINLWSETGNGTLQDEAANEYVPPMAEGSTANTDSNLNNPIVSAPFCEQRGRAV